MEYEFFYDARYLGTIPIEIYKIKIDDIKKLSQYIVSKFSDVFVNNDVDYSLNSVNSFLTDVEYYLNSIDSLLSDVNYNPYYEINNLINRYPLGRSFLQICISLVLLENKANELCLDEMEINLYNKMKVVYDNKILFSNEEYGVLHRRGNAK